LILTGCDLSSEHNLGSGYYLLGSGSNTTVSKIDKKNSSFYTDIILGEIVDYNFDKRYILIYRNASDKAKEYCNLQDSLWMQQQGKNALQYWIIEKDKEIVYGPLEKKEYLDKRQELKIPETLMVNE
jgi:hypothetical protein